MPTYQISYKSGPKSDGGDAGSEGMARWKSWLGGLGAAVVNRGTPLGAAKLVTTDGVIDAGNGQITGYTIVTAESMDAAVQMARDCPYLEMGSLEVAEVLQM